MSPQAREALERICRVYWYPLYAHARRRGRSPEDAQDLTQGFFLALLQHHWLGRADRERGRFRTFLLRAFERFLANEWDKARALKRGGGQPMLSLDTRTGESRYLTEPTDSRSPERAFERQWALALLEKVLRDLSADYRARGKAVHFEALSRGLVHDGGQLPYSDLAVQLGLSGDAVKVAMHRLRRDYRERVRAEIGKTVATAAEVDAEMRHLFRVLAS